MVCVTPEKCSYTKYSERVKPLIGKIKWKEQTKLNLYIVTLHRGYSGFVLAGSDLAG